MPMNNINYSYMLKKILKKVIPRLYQPNNKNIKLLFFKFVKMSAFYVINNINK